MHRFGHSKTVKLTDVQQSRFLAEWRLLPRTAKGRVCNGFLLLLCRKWGVSKVQGAKMVKEMTDAAV